MAQPADSSLWTSLWPTFISHKIVRAAKIVGFDGRDTGGRICAIVDPGDGKTETFVPTACEMLDRAEIGGWAVLYLDGFRSISPAKAFEEGYKPYPGPDGGEERGDTPLDKFNNKLNFQQFGGPVFDGPVRVGGPVLMSSDNPGGWKLEELLARLREELDRKNDHLAGDGHPIAKAVVISNRKIISLLDVAEQHQRAGLRHLDRIGPDQGPTGKPRVGPGSGNEVPGDEAS